MKALLLLSGGIDSPVAGLLMKKSLELEAVHFSLEPFTGPESVEKSIELAKILKLKTLNIIKHGNIQAEIAERANRKYYFVLARRLMLRTAEELAKKLDCKYLITGENMSQVSSQTLSNMATTDKSVKMHILRPLLTMDKVEIIKLAEKFKTFETSKGPETCDVLGPKNPATNIPEKVALNEERKFDSELLIKKGLEELTIKKI